MLYEFRLPDLGEGITEGEVVKWLVAPGDRVAEHQSVLEIETDKAIVEVPSPHSGKVVKLNKEAGGTVAVGESLVTLEIEGGAAEAASPVVAQAAEAGSVVGRLPAEEAVFASPKARALGRKLGIELARIQGTGPGNIITEADVAGYATAAPTTNAPSPIRKPGLPSGQAERIPVKGVRKAIARNLLATLRNAVSVTGMDEADVTELWALRDRERKVAKERGVHLTFLPFFMKAVQHALVFHPVLNGSMSEDGSEIIVKKFYNIGVAVDTPDGLMVSVVKDVDKKTILELAEELQELSKKAKERKITLEELKGSSFTISNYGTYGGTFATPVINYPDIAILGTGKIVERPWVYEGKVAVRRVLHLSLTFDHRALDGSEAARFLTRLVQYLEDPARIFIESA
ncbi:MAG: 2-oxo acid dehydrogenase subunit E2 [Deltaproteobacteria bacterium]|nr:2-oxo acid dehydrogenase subunit E2 [Deltaproteobacteria bacterium]